jgi:hypothetical protein
MHHVAHVAIYVYARTLSCCVIYCHVWTHLYQETHILNDFRASASQVTGR